MSPGEASPRSHEVNYSEHVQEMLVRLGRSARERGDGDQFLAALREFHRRLSLYPQFGDPLTDLKAEAGHVRLGWYHRS